jgi:hypothetical protein
VILPDLALYVHTWQVIGSLAMRESKPRITKSLRRYIKYMFSEEFNMSSLQGILASHPLDNFNAFKKTYRRRK